MTASAPVVQSDVPRKEEKNEKKNQERVATLWNLFQIIAQEHGKMPQVQPVSRTASMPLSFAQERFSMLHQLETENLVYNISVIRHLHGELNVTALERGVNEIVRRHEVLRTVLPDQQILPAPNRELPMIDCREFPEPESEALRHIRKEQRKPFNLFREPLLRACLLQLSGQEYIFLVVVHQICWDDQSEGVFMHELSRLYSAFTADEPSPLPDLRVQYTDFAHWQRQWYQGEILKKHASYWIEQLRGRLPRMNLSAHRKSRTIIQPFEIAAPVVGKLKKYGRSEDVTLFMTLLAAFQTLLFRCTNQEDMLLFSSFGGRNRIEVKRLIGLFANVLLLRTDMSNAPSFPELLRRVRKMMFGAIEHQDMPFDRLLEMLYEETGQTPAFQVLFVLQNTAMPDLKLPGIRTESFKADTEETNQFDLILYCKETAQGLTGWMRYREGLCEAASYMVDIFQELLTEIADNPERMLPDFPSLKQLPSPLPQTDSESNETEKNPEKYQAPDNALELQLLNIWEEILQKNSVGTEENFFDLGGNSLLAVTMFTEVEKKLGRKLPVTTLLDAPTVKQLSGVLRREGCSPPQTSLVPIHPRSSRSPFFYVPAGGRTALSAMQYAHHLGTDQPVYALQPLGFEKEETPHKRVEDMAAYHLQEILEVQPDGPYYIGGTCFGTRVAFELAQQLQKRGHTVALLALLDPGPPCHNSICLENMETSEKVLHHLRRTLYQCKHDPVNASAKVGYYFRKLLQHFKQGDVPASLMKKLLKRGREDDSSEETSVKLERAQNVLNAHLTALKHYMPRMYPGKITLLRSSEYHARDREGYWIKQWSEFASGGFECRVIQGTHWDLYFQEHKFQELIKTLRDCLHEAQADHVSSVNSKTEKVLA